MDRTSHLWRILRLAAIAAWLAYWLTVTRYALLDDALIHLHYADFLHRLHFITFDGVHHTFGTSSLLYVSLLAVLRGVSTSALLPKVVADVAYLTLLAVVLRQVWKLQLHPASRAILGALLLCLLSPMGIRWLTDGMETGLTNLFVVLLALTLKAEQGNDRMTAIRYAGLVVFGALIVSLRIELCLLIALCCCSLLVVKAARKNLALAMVEASPLALGGVLAMLAIRLVMGSFLPDTALAKSTGHITLDPIRASLQVMSSSLLFGAGAALVWAISLAVVVLRARRQGKKARWVPILLENCAIAVVLGMACLRGQVVQGVRYFIWAFVFAIVSNAVRLAQDESSPAGAHANPGIEKSLAIVFAVFFLCALPFDLRWASAAMRGRSQTFLQMRASHLDGLFRDKTIVAGDVGFITYFTNARTCDTEGLVNGRVMAAQSREQRDAVCAATAPAMLFVTQGSLSMMEKAMPLDDWKVCQVYDFTNVRHNDRHYVLVPPADAERDCTELGFAARPMSTIAGDAP